MSDGEKGKMKKLIILNILLFFAFIGCSKEPNDVGFGLLPENEILNVQVYEDSVEVYAENIQNFITHSSSGMLLIGNFDSISCSILIRFDLPDTLRNVKINWARVRLFKVNYVIGDSTFPIHFTAHKILSNYYDTLYDSKTIGEFNSKPDSVNYFQLDTSIVREWLLGKNYGLYLKPVNQGVIYAFHSFDGEFFFIPALEIEVLKEDSNVDTLRFTSGSDGYIASLNEKVDSNDIVLQAGVGLRSILKFDISKFLKDKTPKDIIVNRAEVSLYLKEKKKYIGGKDSLVASFITDTNLVKRSLGGYEGNYLGLKNQLDTLEYVIPVTTPVQRWINGETNNGILIRCYSESDNFDRFVFHYSERKPKLKIYYTKKPRI